MCARITSSCLRANFSPRSFTTRPDAPNCGARKQSGRSAQDNTLRAEALMLTVFDNMITIDMRSGHGAGSFPLLAGADYDAGHRRLSVGAIAARIRLGGGGVSRYVDTSGDMQSDGSGGAGDFQQAELLARGERSRRHSAHRLQDCELDGAGMSAEPAADLRSAGDAVRARRRFHTEFAGAGNGGNAAAHGVRHADGGAHQPGLGFARPDDCQWIGPRHRHNFAQRRDGCGRTGDWRAGHGHRRVLPERKQEIVPEGAGTRRDYQRIPHRMASGTRKIFRCATELSRG